MNVLALLKSRFQPPLAALVSDAARQHELLEMIRVAQDAKFGDYQANFAMPLAKQLGKSPRDVATQLVAETQLDDLCLPPEIAGPGFINLRLKDDWLALQLGKALPDDRLGIEPAARPRTIIIDYSSPNVAKPMHVGHIRSTVIGDALCRTLRFRGHKVISDNHLGDWGTQFGMIIYGYKNFLNTEEYQKNPVGELGRLYKLVSQLVDYREMKKDEPAVRNLLKEKELKIDALTSRPKTGDKATDKKMEQAIQQAQTAKLGIGAKLWEFQKKIAKIESDPLMASLAASHPSIDTAVLEETAKLHAGDEENLRLWHEFLPNCRDEIRRVYGRLDVQFDHEHGESFYHDALA
ncbi:MAG TPA: arginine--tRNA ligase, partial [Pirellulaceae bacterium]|nr:arginine--tRNA ligase [Pirellulaceae bacterium]